jgi:hypothetical protein
MRCAVTVTAADVVDLKLPIERFSVDRLLAARHADWRRVADLSSLRAQATPA